MTISKQVKSFPKYQIHKASNQAFVWWNSKRHYLGTANSKASIELYNRFIAEIAQAGKLFQPQSNTHDSEKITVAALMVRYLRKIQFEISDKEVLNTGYSCRPLRTLYGHTPLDEFSPKMLKLVQQEMIREGFARKVINQRIGRGLPNAFDGH